MQEIGCLVKSEDFKVDTRIITLVSYAGAVNVAVLKLAYTCAWFKRAEQEKERAYQQRMFPCVCLLDLGNL